MYKICIFGETYSENLGDGVIAESIRHIIASLLPDATITYHDMTGRRGWRQDQQIQPDAKLIPGLKRGFGLNLTGRFKTVRRFYTLLSLLAAKYRGEFPKLDGQAFDLAIIGGGQLIMDNELSFPTKLYLLARALGKDAQAIAVYSCGVGSNWSIIGRWLYRRVLRDQRMTGLTVRDTASRENLSRHFGFARDAIDIIPDPALLAASAYKAKRVEDSNTIGLGIMGPLWVAQAIKPEYSAKFNTTFLTQLWAKTAVGLLQRGYQVSLFTNGAPGDQNFAETVYAALPSYYQASVTLCPRPYLPSQLVNIIAGFRGIIAQRLHSHIIAYSLGIPSVGLVWDNKVEEFGDLTGRRQFFLDVDRATPDALNKSLDEALAEDVDAARRRELQARTYAASARLLQRLGWTTSPSPRLAED
jgi:polysaccharide pyruvyl transferase WcaK-like protein